MAISPINLRYVFFGTGSFGKPSLQTLIELGAKPALVVTSPDKPSGRGLHLSHSPIKEVALHANIPILQPANVNDPVVVDQIRQYRADLGVLIAYGQKIGPVLINIFPRGIINLHASLLPKYRGAAPVNWAIISGERETGVTVMQISEQIDAGKILLQQRVSIEPAERADELHNRLSELGPQLIVETIFQIEQNSTQPKLQNIELATKAPKLSKSLSKINWQESADKIANLIRGLWPWPTATSTYKNLHVSIARAISDSAETKKEPGTILDDYSIAAGGGVVKILEIQPSGSKLMSWQDFINGRRVKPGEKFL